MSRSSPAAPVPLIDLGRVLASQLIVWHHLTLYSPLQARLQPFAPELWAWLADPARMAVQIFLVIGGYLAARQWMPQPGARGRVAPGGLPAALWQRYLRLVPACLVAVGAAVLCAALARQISDDPALPAAPSAMQWWANLLLIQDIVGEDALTAGLWYVAIDLQLFMLLLLISAVRHHSRWRTGLTLLLVGGLTAGSLFGFNLQRDLDMWAPYFFGAYGLGMLAAWVHGARAPAAGRWGLLVMGLLIVGALALAWRDRLVVAGITALCLASRLNSPAWSVLAGWRPLAWLARTSYAVFLAHYPVCLLTGALVPVLWPDSTPAAGLGLLATWGLSLLAGWALHAGIEQPVMAWLRRPAHPAHALPAAAR